MIDLNKKRMAAILVFFMIVSGGLFLLLTSSAQAHIIAHCAHYTKYRYSADGDFRHVMRYRYHTGNTHVLNVFHQRLGWNGWYTTRTYKGVLASGCGRDH